MKSTWVRIVVYLVLFFAGPVVAAMYFLSRDGPSEGPKGDDMAWAFSATALLALIILWILEISSSGASNPQRRVGYVQVLLGSDGRVSTSKMITGLWTMYFLLALVLLSTLAFVSPLSADDAFGGEWDSYFLLLGGPFAAAVAAKGIVVGRLNADPTAKTNIGARSESALTTTELQDAEPSALDVVTKDSGDTDLVNTQFALFTVVAIFYFVGALVDNAVSYTDGSQKVVGLPTIPTALLALTSVSALTYVGNKAVQTSGLRLVSIETPVTAQQPVTATVVNLPTTASIANTIVTLEDEDGDVRSVAPTSVTAGEPASIIFRAPVAGTYQVTIVGPGSVAGPVQLEVTE